MYLDYSSVYVNKSTLLSQWRKVLSRSAKYLPISCRFWNRFCQPPVSYSSLDSLQTHLDLSPATCNSGDKRRLIVERINHLQIRVILCLQTGCFFFLRRFEGEFRSLLKQPLERKTPLECKTRNLTQVSRNSGRQMCIMHTYSKTSSAATVRDYQCVSACLCACRLFHNFESWTCFTHTHTQLEDGGFTAYCNSFNSL